MPSNSELSDQQRAWVEMAIPKVRALARALSPTISHASLSELESAGFEGLVEAALRYRPETGVPFAAFAHYRARGAMIDAARRAAPEVRRRSRALRALEMSQALLEQADKRSPDPSTVEQRTLQERVDAAAEIVAQTTMAVLLAKLAPADPDRLQGDGPTGEDKVLAAEERAHLDQALHDATPAENALVDGLYVRGLSMQEFADEVGSSKSTVSRHHAKLLDKLAKRMRQRPWLKDS